MVIFAKQFYKPDSVPYHRNDMVMTMYLVRLVAQTDLCGTFNAEALNTALHSGKDFAVSPFDFNIYEGLSTKVDTFTLASKSVTARTSIR